MDLVICLPDETVSQVKFCCVDLPIPDEPISRFLMNVFIAGATGVLGRRVVSELIGRHHRIVGLSRSDRNDALLKQLGAEPRAGDLFDPASVAAAAADCDAILHLATAIPPPTRRKASDWLLNDRIRREGTRNLLEAALKNGPKLYVQQSITFLYGDCKGEWVDESTPISSAQRPNIQSAADMEGLVARAIVKHHLPAITLRFGSFYCHDSPHTAVMFDLINRGRFPIVGDGSAYWNPIHADDAALAVVQAVEAGSQCAGRVFNVCDPEPVRYGDLVECIAQITGGPKPKHISPFIARFTLGRDTVQFFLSSARCKSDAARSDLGWKPKYPSYREGSKATWDHLLAAAKS